VLDILPIDAHSLSYCAESAASNQAGENHEDLEAGAEGAEGEEEDGEEATKQEHEKSDSDTVKPKEKTAEDLEAGKDEEEDEGPKVDVSLNYFSCKVCFDRPIQTVLIPCGHEALCKKCSKKMKVCPICRKAVQRVQAVLQI